MVNPLIDSHCHLNYPALAKQLEAVIHRAREAGVVRMLTACTTLKSFPEMLEAALPYDDVVCSIGVHPHHCAEEGEFVTADDIIKLTDEPKVVAIGETGLDYFYDYAPREEQHRNFREHIRAAMISGLPLIVHSRDAEEDTIRLLREEMSRQIRHPREGGDPSPDGEGRANSKESSPNVQAGRWMPAFAGMTKNGGGLKGIMHCFSSSRKLAEDALTMGFYISFSGILTFSKSEELRSIARDIPMDRLLVETDAPYLAPEPYRGKLCEPAFVAHTARKLAEVKETSFEDIATQTTANFFRLFNKVMPL